MESFDAQTVLCHAEDLARRAGRIALDRLGSRPLAPKADGSVVTEADHEVQAMILAFVAEHHPNHGVFAEEMVRDATRHADRESARYCWIIDPIDGTRNYSFGLPVFATSIGVVDRGDPVVGVVIEHNTGATFAAIKGGGATLNGRPLRLVADDTGRDPMIGLGSDNRPLARAVARALAEARGFQCRNLGSLAMHLALVASGGLGAAFATRCKVWDMAAGALLVTEAGGILTDPQGRSCLPFDMAAEPNLDLPILAARPDLHARLIDIVRKSTIV